MTTTVFVNGVTLTDSDWFNEVDRLNYTRLRAVSNYLPDGYVTDASVDYTTYAQAAIDSFGTTANLRGGILHFDVPIKITSTLLVSNKSIWIMGNGISTSNAAASGTYIKWGGVAGTPMLKIRGCLGAKVTGLRFIGNSAAKPTAAINFNRNLATDTWTNTGNHVANIVIGNLGGLDSDSGVEFDNGILVDGDVANNEFNTYDDVYINQVTTGVNISTAQSANHHFRNLRVENCTTGLIGANGTNGVNWVFANNAVDLKCLNGAFITIREFRSELAGRLFATDSSIGDEHLIIEGGSWQVSNSINADGKVIDAVTSSQTAVELRNFRFGTIGGYTGPTFTLSLKDSAAAPVSKYLRLINVDGIAAANIDVTTASGGPQYRFVEVINQGTPGALTNLVFRNILSAGESIDTTRWDSTAIKATTGTITALLYGAANSPAQITAAQNDYDAGSNTVARLSTDASRNITGFSGGVAGKVKIVINVGTQPIVLVHGSASSAAANRLYTNAAGTSITLTTRNESATFVYDAVDTVWRCIGQRT